MSLELLLAPSKSLMRVLFPSIDPRAKLRSRAALLTKLCPSFIVSADIERVGSPTKKQNHMVAIPERLGVKARVPPSRGEYSTGKTGAHFWASLDIKN